MIYFKEGAITLLYIPFDADVDEYRRENIEHVLFEHQFDVPNWEEYNDVFEGFIICDDTCEKEATDIELNNDDHIESYFNVDHVFDDVSDALKKKTGIEDIMVCSGQTCYCVLPLST